MASPRPDGVRHPLIELTAARLIEFVRDPSAIFWVFGFPVLLAVVLGIAFRNQGPEIAEVAVIGDGAAELVARLEANPLLAVTARTDTAHALDELSQARVDLVVRVGALDPDGPAVTYRYDPTRPGALATRHAMDRAIQSALGRRDVVAVEEERVEEAGGRYIDFLVPGLIGLNIMGSCMWGLGYAIVDARRRKLLKRFAVTPMNRSHYMLAFFFSRLLFLVLEVALLVAFGWLVFDVRVHGAVLSLGVVALVGMAAFSGLALLIASRTESTEVASGWMNLVQMPMWLLSGSFFAYSRFPEFLHPFFKLLPLTALNDALRAVASDGASLVDTWSQLLIMGIWGTISFLLALKVFRWQ
jgi:ABC-2 type transport system permease protein